VKGELRNFDTQVSQNSIAADLFTNFNHAPINPICKWNVMWRDEMLSKPEVSAIIRFFRLSNTTPSSPVLNLHLF
jgi:hypothetical protein